MLRAGRAPVGYHGPRVHSSCAERHAVNSLDAPARAGRLQPPLGFRCALQHRSLRVPVPHLALRARRESVSGVSLRVRSRGERAAEALQAAAPITVWVKRLDVPGAQYVAVKGVDLQQTVDDFKARWLAQEQLDVRPSLVTLRLVKRGAGKPTAKQEAKAKVLDDPSLSLAEAKVTGTAWLLLFVVGTDIERLSTPGTRLVDAPELVPSPTSPEVFFFREPGGAPQLLRTFFLDPGLVLTKRLKGWISQLRQRHIGFNRFGDDAALSLFLSGAPKTGKSLLLTKVIPALLREDEMFGVGRAAEARVWQVDTTSFNRRNGAAGFLCSLLDNLIVIAAKEGVAEVAHFQKGPRAYSTVDADLRDFIDRLPRNRPTFILLDEVQNFFLLEKDVVSADGSTKRVLDEGEIMTMRRAFKPLVGSSPLHCIWVLTGSKMALFWANIALCPVNGYSLLTHIPTVRLPTSVPDAVKLQAWEVLRHEYEESELPQQLLVMSPQHHAALVFFCNEWLRMGHPVDCASFVAKTLTSKVYPEIVEDYRLVLDTLNKGQRKIMLELFNSPTGVSERVIPRGVSAFLEDDLVKLSETGLEVHLDSPLVSRAIQALMDGDGELLKGDDPSATMLSLTERDEFRTFGELLSKPHASTVALLEEMVASVDSCFWKSEWFQKALDDNLEQPNARIARAYAKGQAEGDLQPCEHMRFYLQLWNNCVRHAEAKKVGLAHEFVISFPSSLWLFVRNGKVQSASASLRLHHQG